MHYEAMRGWSDEVSKKANELISEGDLEQIIPLLAVRVDLHEHERSEGYGVEVDLEPRLEAIRSRFSR